MFIKRSSPDVTLEEWSRLLNNLEVNIMKIEEDIKKIKKILNIEDKRPVKKGILFRGY